MRFASLIRALAFAPLRRFARDNKANVAMMFGLSLVPLLIATGAGIDFARGVMIRQQMLEALDAAALAVGNATSKPAACTTAQTACAELKALAQRYFNENYDSSQNGTYGTPNPVDINISGQAVTLTATLPLKLSLLGVVGITSPLVSASSTVVWGQTKLWVALVLDNSGSMDQGDNNGSKMAALKDALNSTSSSAPGLLKILKDAAAAEGDVRVGIVPFANSVRPGWSSDSSYIDWSEWEGYPVVLGATPDDHKIVGYNSSSRSNANKTGGIEFAAFGPGDDCPFTNHNNGRRDTYDFYCTESASNSADTVDEIPDSGSRKGYICPGRDYGASNKQSHNYQYYNGCFTSTRVSGEYVQITNKSSSASCSNTGFADCDCTGSGSNKYCRVPKWSHTWFSNSRSWSNCVGDRQKKDMQTAGKTGPRVAASKNYDASKDAPVSGTPDTLFPAMSSPLTCVASSILPIPSNWTASQWSTLGTKVTNMDAGGSTNQGIGMAHGWLMLTPGAPYNTGISSIADNITRIVILFSDGLNTQNRWWGDGATENTTEDGYIDDRTEAICQAAKDDKIIIYSIYVHIGNNGNSSTLQNCASSTDKYYDLTSSASIKDAFKDIAQKITNLRVSQ